MEMLKIQLQDAGRLGKHTNVWWAYFCGWLAIKKNLYLIYIILFLLKAVQQQKPVMVSPTKLVATNGLLARSYNSGTVMSTPRVVSATQIAKQLLHTQGIQGLYKGLGATLMR